MTIDAKIEYIFSIVETFRMEVTSLRRDINALYRVVGKKDARSKKKKKASEQRAEPEGQS